MKQLQGIQTGIVLKKYATNKIALLDKELGRINVNTDPKSSVPAVGALINYTLNEHNGYYFLKAVDLIDIPLELAREDILFFHHALELSYYCLSVGVVNEAVFTLLLTLYMRKVSQWRISLKKVFLFKLLAGLGWHPEHSTMPGESLSRMLRTSIDKIIDESIDLDCHQDVHNWLRFCISEHPYVNSFKTTLFLNKSR
jgi:hypothetical protein